MASDGYSSIQHCYDGRSPQLLPKGCPQSLGETLVQCIGHLALFNVEPEHGFASRLIRQHGSLALAST